MKSVLSSLLVYFIFSSKLSYVSFPLLNIFLIVFFFWDLRRIGKYLGLTGALFVPKKRMEDCGCGGYESLIWRYLVSGVGG